jgi:hypothetical protein
MGCYINPQSMSKEEWLKVHGTRANGPTAITEDTVPVCLVDNGPFTAAAVAYDERELAAFSDPRDNRMKFWFQVRRDLVRQVSDLARYESTSKVLA